MGVVTGVGIPQVGFYNLPRAVLQSKNTTELLEMQRSMKASIRRDIGLTFKIEDRTTYLTRREVLSLLKSVLGARGLGA